MILASGGNPIYPLVVHQPASPVGSVHKSRGDNDIFVLSWARVQRGSISSELIMCGGGVRIIVFCG